MTRWDADTLEQEDLSHAGPHSLRFSVDGTSLGTYVDGVQVRVDQKCEVLDGSSVVLEGASVVDNTVIMERVMKKILSDPHAQVVVYLSLDRVKSIKTELLEQVATENNVVIGLENLVDFEGAGVESGSVSLKLSGAYKDVIRAQNRLIRLTWPSSSLEDGGRAFNQTDPWSSNKYIEQSQSNIVGESGGNKGKPTSGWDVPSGRVGAHNPWDESNPDNKWNASGREQRANAWSAENARNTTEPFRNRTRYSLTKYVIFPNSIAGFIIGHKGTTLIKLQDTYGGRCEVRKERLQPDVSPELSEFGSLHGELRVLEVKNNEEGPIASCIEEVKRIISMKIEPPNHIVLDRSPIEAR